MIPPLRLQRNYGASFGDHNILRSVVVRVTDKMNVGVVLDLFEIRLSNGK